MAKMKAKKRDALPDEMFGLPDQRKYPLNDKRHVKAAVRLFGKCPDEDKPRLARNILRRANELGMDSSGWKVVHAWARKESDKKKDDKKEEDVKQEYVALSEFNHFFVESEAKLPNGITLRKATKYDIDYIYECELQTVSSDEKKDPNYRKEIEKDARDSVSHTKIIMLNEHRVGIYQAYATNKWGLKEGEKDWWYIAEIYLSPSARGKGIGTSIIETDISNHDKLLLNVLKENEKAIKLYKRLGFKIDQEFDNRYIMRLVKSKTFQESTQHTQIGYRFTYDGEGIYEALKKAMFKKTNSSSAWMQFKNSTACTWLPVPPQYKGNDELNSYFTEEGRDKFKKLTIPYMKHYLDSDKIKEDKVDISSMEVVYSDEYQYVVKVFNLTVPYIKEAIKKIHEKTLKDKKPPTGNQNCQLCTWCLEAQCRGIDAVPRAVYSPRDKAFDIDAPSIVVNPKRIPIKDRNDVLSKVKEAGDNARFYVHVNWKDSKGGHEFMLINVDSKVYLADAQQGEFIEFGSKENDYFDNTNYPNSYLVRLDDKKLNKELLDEATDESKTLPWDEKKDIPYMKEHGLLSDDDEEHAKKTGLITETTSDMIKVNNFKYNKVYYGAIHSGEKHRKLSSPLFVTPYIGIASVFAGREKLWPELRKRGVIGETNLDYYEWGLPEKDLNKIFRIVHVTVQVPSSNTACKTDVEPFEIKLKGYIHTVDTTDLKDDIYQYKWMDKTREYLIDVPEIDIKHVEEIETRYIVTVKRMTKEQDEHYQSRRKSKPVQEQVIPDAISDMIPILKSSEYGIGYKGKLITDPTNADYNEKWHCLSPEEFLECHGGVCYDYVEWEADYLEKHDIKFKKFHISYHVGFDKNDPGEDASTHSICVAIVDGKYIYIEGSNKRLAKKMNYVKEFDDLDKLLDFAVENMQHDSKQNKLMIIDYTNVKGFIGWNVFGYQGKIFSEGKVIRSDFIQEQFVEESYRDEHFNKLYFHLSPESYLDGQVFKPRVPEYLDRYDPEDKNFENDTTPRVCFSPSIEGCLNGIMVNMPRVNVLPKTKFYVYIPEKPFHEYKHKTNKELIRDKDVFDASVTDEVWILEPVRMKLYGVIEIDSVYNVKRKRNVPTASGKKSTRPYYKYKWHWLVKPKVLEKGSRFNYSIPRVIENLSYELPKFRYGLIRDGRLIKNPPESDYDKYWKLASPEEIDRAGGGICYDMVEWEAGYLDSYGINCNRYFIFEEPEGNEKNKDVGSTHTFIVVKNGDEFIYIEGSFQRVYDEIGYTKTFKSLDEIFEYVGECLDEINQFKNYTLHVFDYSDAIPKIGSNMHDYQSYIIDNGEEVFEKPFTNKKEGDSK